MKRRPLTPWIVLVASLLLTAAATWAVADSVRARDEERFNNAVLSTKHRIEARLETYIALLRGGTGLFAANRASVAYDEFQDYTDRLDIQQRYPGIQGIGFTQRFALDSRDSLVAAMRRQGFEDFRVWPDAPGSERHTILYLEPLDQRNRAAIGYDMFSEPTRRAAMSRARDTGMPAVSGRVTLVQEISGRKQAGFLIYLPVYRSDEVPEIVAERQALLEGFVYAPFRADDLFAGIFSAEERPRIAFRIYDGQPAEENLLHDSRTGGIAPADSPDFTRTTELDVGGRTWTITFAATSFFAEGSRRSFIPVLLVVGSVLSLMLFSLSLAQVKAENAARGSEYRLRTVLESLPVGVFVADKTGRITFANPASRKIGGNSEYVSVGRHTERGGGRADPAHGIQGHEWSLARALKGEHVENEIVDVKTLDGTHKTVLSAAFPVRNAAGKVEMAVAAVVDITEQRRAEAALREREQEFRTMADSIPQLVWMADESGYIFWYNHRWYDYTGATLEELQGEGWKKRVGPQHSDQVMARFKHHIEAGEAWEDIFPLCDKEGRYRWFLSRAVPIRDEMGRIIRWFGTNTDITEQKQAREAEARAIREQAAREAAEAREGQLRLHTAELERSNRELQEFAYVASHDLQEPLRKISSFADILVMEYGEHLDEEGRHYLNRMQQAAIRMSRLIRDLLTFSRVTTKTQPFKQVDLNRVLEDVLSDLEMRLKETGAHVEADNLPAIEADPVQMRQLLQNLIGNAVKFHRKNVPPIVSVRAAIEETATSFTSRKQKVCRLEVQDNGIGFDEKYLDRMFAPFQQLHRKAEYDGTGIGLAICRRIVDRHRGMIEAKSTLGDGSTFIVTLPVKQE